MPDYPRLYPFSQGEAQRTGELEAWEQSFRENVACSRDIEQRVRDFYDGGEGLLNGCARAVTDRWGFRRTQFVLSNTLRRSLPSRPLDPELRQWGEAPFVPPDAGNRYFEVDTANSLLNAFLGQLQREYQALGLFGTGHRTEDADYEGKVLILSPQVLKESCWTPENQLWYAHRGFGCSPTARGRSISCTCLGDGELARWDRNDFIGVMDEALLPDWARGNLEKLRAGQEIGPAETPCVTMEPMIQPL